MFYRIKNQYNRFKDKVKENLYPKIVRYNYRNDIKRIREKALRGEKINVIFYTNEPQKWSYGSVYKEFEKSPYFSPLILVVPRYRVHTGKDKTRMSLKEQYNFYKERNYNVEYGYINGEYVDIKKFSPDVFFYLQLAEIPDVDDPILISRFALTFYCSYAFQLANYGKQYLQKFHKLLYLNYLENDKTYEIVDSYRQGNSRNCLSVGYPKLDVYINKYESLIDVSKYWTEPEKFKIIYAPHHSFQKTKGNIFNFGTFPQNYKFILELARKSKSKTTWIFKPHPMLRYTIVSEGLMTDSEADEYYKEWAKIGKIFDTGDYFDIFKTSDLMITDCSSFLAEYLPSNKPLIRLINPKSIDFNIIGKQLSACFYSVHNNEELTSVFDDVVLNNNDYLTETRKEIANTLIDVNETAGRKIYNDLYNRLIKQDN